MDTTSTLRRQQRRTAAATAPSRGQRFPALDGVRAIAALSVLAFHVTGAGYIPAGPVNRLFDHLNAGVTLFFLLSGFLLYRPFVLSRTSGSHVDVRTYLRRRFFRIVPAYWVALLVFALWPGLPGFFSGPWISDMSFAQIYSLRWYHSGLPVAWSLCTEISFYLVLPLYAAGVSTVVRKASARTAFYAEVGILAVLALLAVGIHAKIASHPALVGIGVSLPATAYLFCAGMLLAICSVHHQELLSRALLRLARHRAACWLAAAAAFVTVSLISLPMAGYRGSFLGPTHPLYIPAAFLLLLPLTLAPAPRSRLDRFLTSRPAVLLGLVSYGIYLWHYPLVTQMGHIFGHAADGIPVLLSTVAVACLAAALSYTLVERPLQRLSRRPPRVRQLADETLPTQASATDAVELQPVRGAA